MACTNRCLAVSTLRYGTPLIWTTDLRPVQPPQVMSSMRETCCCFMRAQVSRRELVRLSWLMKLNSTSTAMLDSRDLTESVILKENQSNVIQQLILDLLINWDLWVVSITTRIRASADWAEIIRNIPEVRKIFISKENSKSSYQHREQQQLLSFYSVFIITKRLQNCSLWQDTNTLNPRNNICNSTTYCFSEDLLLVLVSRIMVLTKIISHYKYSYSRVASTFI